jgi:hypothetical protein
MAEAGGARGWAWTTAATSGRFAVNREVQPDLAERLAVARDLVV